MRTQLTIRHALRRSVATVLAAFLIGGCAGPGGSAIAPDGSAGAPATPSGVDASASPGPSESVGVSAEPVAAVDLQLTIPAEAAFAEGTDPFVEAAPQECDPGTDQVDQPDYIGLAQFDPIDVRDELAINGVTNVGVAFQNEKGQRFDVVVSGASDQAIEDYIAAADLCLEALPIKNTPQPIPQVDLVAILVAASGNSIESLAEKRDELIGAGSVASLGEVVDALGGDSGATFEAAKAVATAAIDTALADGTITTQELAGTDVQALLDALLRAPGAPFLTDPAKVAQDASAWAEILQANESAVLVTFDSVDRGPGDTEFDVVWFAEDPPIDDDGYRGYRAICSTWAGVRIYASRGSATVRMWRYNPFLMIGSRYDKAGGTSPGWLSASAERTSWDAGVSGWEDGSYYSLYGGWTEGTGGGC